MLVERMMSSQEKSVVGVDKSGREVIPRSEKSVRDCRWGMSERVGIQGSSLYLAPLRPSGRLHRKSLVVAACADRR